MMHCLYFARTGLRNRQIPPSALKRARIYNVGVLTFKVANDTVYIEEGAVVSGCVYADHCDKYFHCRKRNYQRSLLASAGQ